MEVGVELASDPYSSFLLPALALSALINLVAGGHFLSSLLPTPSRSDPPALPHSLYYSSPSEVWGEEGEEQEVEQEEEEEEEDMQEMQVDYEEAGEQRFEDMYTKEVYYNLPRSLPQYQGLL